MTQQIRWHSDFGQSSSLQDSAVVARKYYQHKLHCCIADALRMVCLHGCSGICAVRYSINKLGACRPIGILHSRCAGHFWHHALPCYRPMHARPHTQMYTPAAKHAPHSPQQQACTRLARRRSLLMWPQHAHARHHIRHTTGGTATCRRPLHLHTGSIAVAAATPCRTGLTSGRLDPIPHTMPGWHSSTYNTLSTLRSSLFAASMSAHTHCQRSGAACSTTPSAAYAVHCSPDPSWHVSQHSASGSASCTPVTYH